MLHRSRENDVSLPRTSLCLPLLGLIATVVLAGEPAQTRPPVDFARQVYPVLQRACFECHGPEKHRGGLRLDSRRAVLEGGDSGPALLPGAATKSELYRRITRPRGSDGVMPARGELLTRAQTELLRDWIDQGAPWSETVQTARHWSYVKPVCAPLPHVKDTSWPRNPIDHFVLARLEKEGLKPSPEADRATLIRRVSLDLIGLPPTPAEVDAFLADTRPDAYERVVDRLLASPAFGERWARPWLDLARYADSHGFQRDDLRSLWPYRDWVIRALNADMPFDRFTIEQIAGDLLPGATIDQKVATGFHRSTPTNVEAGSEPEETRVNQVLDRVNTTAAVWLGTTLECAQCHNHKYDPFTQKDYYRVFAYFNSTAIEADRSNPRVPGSIRFLGPSLTLSDHPSPERDRLAAELKRLEADRDVRRKQLTASMEKWEAALAASLGKSGEEVVLEVSDFVSSAGSPHRVLDDQSVLLVDDPPDRDTYTVTVRTKRTGITAFKLETLTDPSLPGKGPGRGDAARPNFVLNTFEVRAAPTDKEGNAQKVTLVRATADFSQKNYDVSGAIDNRPKTAWAIGQAFHKPHWAIFDTDKPVGFAGGSTLTFRLVQDFGRGRTIGRLRLLALTGDRQARALPANVAAILKTPRAKRTPVQSKRLLDYRLETDPEGIRLRRQQDRTEAALQKLQPASSLVMQELPTPRKSTLFKRGNWRTPGEPVRPGTPAILHPLQDGPPNRLSLARWLVDRDNPLVARVTVNRWWAELFGRGIVSTVEDFGVKGEPPTHPELLDWLAVEFMDPTRARGTIAGWSMKRLLRTVVLSATYRQSSAVRPELRERDDQNRLLARGPRFRLSAEMIRDNALAAAGLLSHRQFGPPVRPYQPDGLWAKIGGAKVEYIVSPGEDRYRRGVYVVWKRSAPYPSFINFDATARLACTVKRSRTNTPLQALTLLNDPVYVEVARALARRVLTEQPGADTDERIRHAFRLCLARTPRESELRILHRLYEAQRRSSHANPAGTRELLAGMTLPKGVAPEEFAAWYAVATALLNLDEMITRG
jgi:mono/diheme cytochrome c family protein